MWKLLFKINPFSSSSFSHPPLQSLCMYCILPSSTPARLDVGNIIFPFLLLLLLFLPRVYSLSLLHLFSALICVQWEIQTILTVQRKKGISDRKRTERGKETETGEKNKIHDMAQQAAKPAKLFPSFLP